MLNQPIITDDDVKSAIDKKEIYLVYQPIVSIETDTVVAYEALARWKFNGQLISPNYFTKLNAPDLMRSLTQYILKLAEKVETKLKIPIHVNINIWDLDSFIDAKISCLEITEHDSKQESIESINQLAKNYNIVLDDFGKDYAFWIEIPYLNLSKIKLDKLVIDQLMLKHTLWFEEIIRFIVKKANDSKIKIVAEGVEDIQQQQILEKLGVHEMQGFLLGKPFRIDI